ncbi:MAG: cupin domain-containing protein [Alphaproteobacteria bacterium]|nr:cupin domain-containing protein [Alphaproteobacteria bacterium]
MEIMVEPQILFFWEDEKIPNNPFLPVLIYRQVLEKQTADKDKIFKRHFEKNGWKGGWTGVIFDYHHFHTTSHEALAIARGHVSVMLGGESGKEIDLEAGDLLVLPAGTGHKMLSQSETLVVVGAYPAGQEHYDICKSQVECPEAKDRIASLAAPQNDPFYGTPGPLPTIWKS